VPGLLAGWVQQKVDPLYLSVSSLSLSLSLVISQDMFLIQSIASICGGLNVFEMDLFMYTCLKYDHEKHCVALSCMFCP